MTIERLSPQQFNRFREFIYQNCGIQMDERKVALLTNRIRRRLKAGDYADFDTYYQYLTSAAGAKELDSFLDAITTNETFFFRVAKHFDWLTSVFLDDFIKRNRAGEHDPTLRIWSAGCANGAEPFSIAICLAENRFRLRGWSLQVVGTDLSTESLQAARAGKFKSRAMEAVSEKQRRRFFRHDTAADLWEIRDEIKQLVSFQRHNLLQPLAEPPFDCIFIRNVLIYFDEASKQTAVKHLIAKLKVGGYLVVGPSEGIYNMLDALKKHSPSVYQKLDGPTAGITRGQRPGVRVRDRGGFGP